MHITMAAPLTACDSTAYVRVVAGGAIVGAADRRGVHPYSREGGTTVMRITVAAPLTACGRTACVVAGRLGWRVRLTGVTFTPTPCTTAPPSCASPWLLRSPPAVGLHALPSGEGLNFWSVSAWWLGALLVGAVAAVAGTRLGSLCGGCWGRACLGGAECGWRGGQVAGVL
ncbi:hypothetical protein GCM10022214_66620 [Actinomadura miaoliensis]|uniref:Uncharacterized protein n=1 Tax=Actinomadura miaoliensis TaxID=430685 RepID=A0ABP7WR67_9ACTN